MSKAWNRLFDIANIQLVLQEILFRWPIILNTFIYLQVFTSYIYILFKFRTFSSFSLI